MPLTVNLYMMIGLLGVPMNCIKNNYITDLEDCGSLISSAFVRSVFISVRCMVTFNFNTIPPSIVIIYFLTVIYDMC